MATVTNAEPTTRSELASSRARVPALQQGDRLSRDEFERRYHAMPHVKKAELIEGVVYMPSPARAEQHGDPHADLVTWLGIYRASTKGVKVSDNATVRLDWDNEPQPDASLRILEAYGGQTEISPDGYIIGGPELAAEISASSKSYDSGDKLNAFRHNGVKEYIVWRVDDEEVDWYVHRGGEYERLSIDESSATRVYRSEVFPGLWLDIDAMLQGNMAQVIAVLQQGLESDAHRRFVEELEQKHHS